LLLPLRGFLGVTFCYAGLQKLANPAYLDPNSPTSVAAQMHALRHSSPIGPLLALSQHAPTLVGVLIAIGELAVGVGTLFGIYSRFAAAGGALLSLTFFLTVSWGTTPYYYGSDIVFVFAWLTLFGFGTGDVLSLEAWIRRQVRQEMGLRPGAKISPRAQAALDRRTVVQTGVAAALLGAMAAVTGGLTAAIGRAVGGSKQNVAARSQPPVSTSPPASRSSTTHHAPGTAIAQAASIPVGQAKSFTDPASGNPAWAVHPEGNTFVAFSAVCTHAGCPVQYDPSNTAFVCPCHGGVYDARTGQVLQGPPPAPLQRIAIQVVGGQLRVGT
jgi:thiosulfate dehydrogenase [quinone] large subunit